MDKVSKTSLEKAHIDWIDVAKGLGLVLVIWGHLLYSGSWDIVNRAIYSFHMPMYFIISGFVAHPRKTTLKKRICSQAYRLLLPSIVFIALTIPLHLFTTKDKNLSLFQHLKLIFYVDNEIAYNDPVWFFIVLFTVTIIVELCNILSLSFFKRGLIFAFCLCTAFILYHLNIPLIFGIRQAILAMVFYLFGNFLKYFTSSLKKHWLLLGCIVSVPIWVISGVIFNSKVSMYAFTLGNYWLFVISGITGSIVWLGFSYILRKAKIAKIWSKNTIFIVGSHYVGVTICSFIANKIGIANTVWFDVGSFVITIFALLLYIPICNFINQYLPFMNGKQYAKNSTIK